MLRKLNFTERAKIRRSTVRIDMRREHDGVLAFDANLDLAGIDAPGNARIYIEAQYRTSYMRFDCGSLSAVSIPEDRRLTEIDSNRIVRFRVKAVEDRRIVAASNDITVSCSSGDEGRAVSLLEVNFLDLGDQVWRVHFEVDQPILELNNRIESIERLAKHDAAFFALVYPAALRAVLTQFLLVDDWEENEEGGDWPELWMKWARDMTGEPVPSDPEDRRAFIEDVIVAFCGRHRVAERMRPASEESL